MAMVIYSKWARELNKPLGFASGFIQSPPSFTLTYTDGLEVLIWFWHAKGNQALGLGKKETYTYT